MHRKSERLKGPADEIDLATVSRVLINLVLQITRRIDFMAREGVVERSVVSFVQLLSRVEKLAKVALSVRVDEQYLSLLNISHRARQVGSERCLSYPTFHGEEGHHGFDRHDAIPPDMQYLLI